MSIRFRLICILIMHSWCMLCGAMPLEIYAQGAPAATVPTNTQGNPPPILKPEVSETIPLKGPNGEIISVLKTPQLLDLYNEYLARKNKTASEPQNWGVASVSLAGTIEGEQVLMRATIKIQSLVDGVWMKIPLRMNEAIFKEQVYIGPGESTPGGFDPEQGYLWWFRGKGTHTLNLTLLLPLTRPDFLSRRLQFSLPLTVVSDLKLQVPIPRITAKLDENSRARIVTTSPHETSSLIELWGLGTRLDLTWQPQPETGSVETVLESKTAITTTIDGQSVLMEANQRFVALQGSFQQVQVKLPRGGELLKVTGDLYKSSNLDPANPQLVTVTLKELVTGQTPVDLKWTVRAEIPSKSERIVIEGFEVSKAKIQTGHLAVRLVGDYRLERIDDQNQFVQRENFSTLEKAIPPFPTREDVSSAYAILRQPFQLAVNLQPEKPHVTVKPRLYLSLSPERMDLIGEYEVRVYRGGIERVHFKWPGWKEEGWKVEPVSPPSMIEETRLDETSGIPVKLINRATNSTDLLTLQIRASRPIPAGSQNLEFSLPSLSDVNLMPAEMIVSVADNLDVDLRPVDTVSPSLTSVSQPNGMLPLKGMSDLRRRDYRLDLNRPRLTLSTTLQKQKISTQTEIELSLDGSDLEFVQRISYDVAYERLSQVLLLVPSALLDRTEFELVLESGTTASRITPISTGAVDGDRHQQRLTLESGRLGKFDIVVKSSMPVNWPATTLNESIALPLILSDDSDFSTLRVRLKKSRFQRLSLVGETWTPQSTQDGDAVWQSTSKFSSLVLKIEQGDGSWRRGISVPRRFAQAAYAPNGEVFCQTQFQIEGFARYVQVTLPRGVTSPVFRWNQVRVETVDLAESNANDGQYKINLPESDTDHNQILTVIYRLPKQGPLGIASTRNLEIPEIQSDDTPTQTYWQILLPSNQHLWTLPIGFLPEFDWTFEGGMWTRKQRHSPEALKGWLGDVGDESVTSNMAYTNRYVFSSLDARVSMTVQLLSSSLAVLIGSSLALILGFLLVNVPSTRHVLTFLCLGFLTALAALWDAEPVMVLLQPVGLGVALSLLAFLSQQAFRRPSLEPVLTLASSREILATKPSGIESSDPDSPKESGTKTHIPPISKLESGVGP